MLLEIQLHALGERVYVTANDGTLSMFGYFEGDVWKEVLQDKLPILGPQACRTVRCGSRSGRAPAFGS